MHTSWHQILGCGHGPVATLVPQTRIMAGVILFATSMVSPATTMPGILLVVAAVGGWLIACGPPWRVVRTSVLFGLAVLLPYFLLAPLIRAWDSSEKWMPAIAPPWGVFLHGMAGILVSTSTATTLSPSDLRSGMLGLPVPGIVSAILLQIVHQTSELVYETRRVAAAAAVRGATTGWRTSMRLLSSIPRVWFPRLLNRADRLAAAMEIRGFCDTDPAAFGWSSMRRSDLAALGVATSALVLAVVLRLGVIG